MPHIAVKLWPGRSEEEKRAFVVRPEILEKPDIQYVRSE